MLEAQVVQAMARGDLPDELQVLLHQDSEALKEVYAAKAQQQKDSRPPSRIKPVRGREGGRGE
jgi:hypothetical protein